MKVMNTILAVQSDKIFWNKMKRKGVKRKKEADGKSYSTSLLLPYHRFSKVIIAVTIVCFPREQTCLGLFSRDFQSKCSFKILWAASSERLYSKTSLWLGKHRMPASETLLTFVTLWKLEFTTGNLLKNLWTITWEVSFSLD